jgi:phage gp46-like protein
MDIAIAFDSQLLVGDIAQVAGDLETDDSIRTAVVISLFTDRLADADDELPAGTAYRVPKYSDDGGARGAKVSHFVGRK